MIDTEEIWVILKGVRHREEGSGERGNRGIGAAIKSSKLIE